ncbi:chitinase A1 [Hypomontagnella monticulosa]|nr:chitinase A1 [Hypomontagnella monticulosa]
MRFIPYIAGLTLLVARVVAQQGAVCAAFTLCQWGCCSAEGQCGYGGAYCGDGCLGNCDAQPECGNGAPENSTGCPNNGCCSNAGFCGTGPAFCDSCQNEGGCSIQPQTCTANTDAMSTNVRIGYYRAESASSSCDATQPENLAAGALTHINVAYEYIGDDGLLTDYNGAIMARTARLKRRYDGLRVNLVLGGYDFTHPSNNNHDNIFRNSDTTSRWANMTGTVPNQQQFIQSLMAYMNKYALDGIDLDWEYPGDPSTGGSPDDYDNFVVFVSNIRQAFDAQNGGWQITVSLPYDYDKLRGFSLEDLANHVDWFNVQTYDLYDLWDVDVNGNGYVRGHFNISTASDTFDLLQRNGIGPNKTVMGIPFFGTSYTLADTSCTQPGCKFDGPGFPASCSNEFGFMNYGEAVDIESQLGTNNFYDKASSTQYMVASLSQWISYENNASFADKISFLTSRCLLGFSIWTLDYDTADFQALAGLVGDEAFAHAIVEDALYPAERTQLVQDLAPYTGQNCFVTQGCTDGTNTDDSFSNCGAGYSSVATGHYPLQIDQRRVGTAQCPDGQWHQVCCPTDHMPKNCKWEGAPVRSEIGCNSGCGSSQYELTRDGYVAATGGSCYQGERSLCCDSTEILQGCSWTDCGTEVWYGLNPCGDGQTSVAQRYDEDNGDVCPLFNRAIQGGIYQPGYTVRSLCCPSAEAPMNCAWSDDGGEALWTCYQKQCKPDKLVWSRGNMPPALYTLTQPFPFGHSTLCDVNGFTWPGLLPEFHLCCDPPSIYTEKWPVLPSYLWSDVADNETDDVTWQFSDDFGNNDMDIVPHDQSTDPGADPFGFVMLDGPKGSISNAFSKSFTVIQRDEPVNVKPRSLLTTNKTVLDNVYTHSEETIRVYCNYPADSPQCREVFYQGAEDTIIRLPHHVGEGPWARIVSMEPEYELSEEFPHWVKRKRDLTKNQNGVYVVKFDYNFHLIGRQSGDNSTNSTSPINLRIDFSNLNGYWDQVTNSSADSGNTRRKRSMDDNLPFHEWKKRIEVAKLDKRNLDDFTAQPTHKTDITRRNGLELQARHSTATKHARLNKRWWGSFGGWLDKLTTIEKSAQGVLPMGYAKYFTLFSGRIFCRSDTGITFTAGMDVTADLQLQMNTRYAYYFQGSLSGVKEMYAYARTQPKVGAGITLSGDAQLGYGTEPRKLINTLTYPGLAIKGIAAVGPSLDIWGQIDGTITVSGSMRAGVTYTFKPIEMYMPNTDTTHDMASKELEDNSIDQDGLMPSFEANVKAEIDFNIRVSPEINMGIQVGGRIGPLDGTLVDAHISAFANTTLNFNAFATAGTSGLDYNWSYGYSVSFLWRIGLAAIAQVKFFGEWRTNTYYPVDWQTIPIVPLTTVSSDDLSPQRRMFKRDQKRSPWIMGENELPNAIFDTPAARARGYHLNGIAYASNSSDYDQPDDTSTGFTKPARRQADNTVADDSQTASTFKIAGQTFTCNSKPPTCGNREGVDMSGDFPTQERKARDVGHWLGGMSSLLHKRAGTDNCATLPRLYCKLAFRFRAGHLYVPRTDALSLDNCPNAFNAFEFQVPTNQGGTGRSKSIEGICETFEQYARAFVQVSVSRGSGQEGICRTGTATGADGGMGCTLTYDNSNTQVNTRRRQTCTVPGTGRSRCSTFNRNLKASLWTNPASAPTVDLTSCDEFPFASSEEGGANYDDSGPVNADDDIFGAEYICAPTWQQSLQGNCNGESLSYSDDA